MTNLTQYLNEMRSELQELFENLDSELRDTENKMLIDDGYDMVVSKLEDALSEMDELIHNIDNGVYDRNDSLDIDDDMLEVDDY